VPSPADSSLVLAMLPRIDPEVRMTIASTRTRHSLESTIKTAIRESAGLRAVQIISSPLVRRWPIESVPGWIGKIHELRVPKGVVPFGMPSPGGKANIKIILSLTKSVLHLSGDLAECGVYRGGTIIPLGLYLAQKRVKKTVFGFDSFAGFGDHAPLEPAEGSAIRTYGSFHDTSYEVIMAKIKHLGLSEQVVLIRGFFESSLGVAEDRRFCFVHLDCDLYDSYKICLNFFYERMVPGGIILFDEYNDPPWPGCNLAVDQFLMDKPEGLMEISSDNYIRYFIRKCEA
jgi:O-methyltransferase